MPGRGSRPAPTRQRSSRHFFRSRALVASLVDGAGEGIIAAELAARGARVVAVELDTDLARGLRRRFAGGAAVDVVCADARRLRPPLEPFRVVANLPFDGGTAILRRLLDDPRVPLTSADVVLEWAAAAKRAAVWPTTLLGAYWRGWHELTLARRVPRSAFTPPPTVDAGLLQIRRRDRPLVPVRDARAYRAFLERCFAGRPRDVVPGRTWKRLASDHGFDTHAAARDLDARQLAALFAAVRALR